MPSLFKTSSFINAKYFKFQKISYRPSFHIVSKPLKPDVFASNPDKDQISSDFSFAEKNFADHVKLTVKAGNGGSGCESYFRDRTTPKGAADGGNGGNGGGIAFRSTYSLNDLHVFKRFHIVGNNGGHGHGRNKSGENGKDQLLNVPLGTSIYEITGFCNFRTVSFLTK